MDQQQNIKITRKLYDEVFTKGQVNVLDEVLAPNVKLHDPAQPHFKDSIASFKQVETTYTKAFPNKKVKIEDIFAVDDKVVVRWTCQGVHRGELQGIAPTNKNFTITGISIYRFTGGKISEAWQSWDRLGLLEQIGEVQPALALH